jgi:DNA-binding SARP family transcriptional activator/tetratricopeptide (TPR) repeat protein
MRMEPGTLRLLTTPRWLAADADGRDVPDTLPGYLLVYLAYRGDWITREALAAAFWPERPQDEALHNLRANLHRVRALLAGWGREGALHAEPRRVRVDLPTDVEAFRSSLARRDWVAAADADGDALLATLSFRGFALIEEWASEERRALAASWRRAAMMAAQAHEQVGDPQRAAALLLHVLEGEPSNEAALKELLRLAVRAGKRDEARAAFGRSRQWLRNELGVEPDRATVALFEEMNRAQTEDIQGGGTSDSPADREARLLLFGPPLLRFSTAMPLLPERRFQLLVILGLRAGEWVPREQIATLLWPEQPTSDARRNLRHTLFKAREIPGAGGIDGNDHALRWNVATDLQAFHAALHEKRLADAVALRRGSLAAGVDDPGNRAFSDWIATERARLDAQWHQAALEHLAALKPPEQRIKLAQRLLQADPLDESAVEAQLTAELELGHRAQVQRLYRDYAARLAEELGVEPPQHLRDLLSDTAGAAAGPASDDGSAFVGRRIELAELALLLAQPDCRLVTILGPGGVGKSSLARRALAQVAASFAGGAVWIELQDLDGIAPVLTRLAGQLNLTLNDAQDPLVQIARQLRGKRTLAVLDNAEHLAELPLMLQRLIEEAETLSIMVTSRIRMRGRHERVLPLEGLAVPDDESRDLEVASTFDAVRLFELRASAAQRGFRLASCLPAVIDIVDAVGGLPLAIELAASWVRLLPAEEIARDLRGAIDVLERDPAASGAPSRPEHASVRQVLERSWHLLAPREREAMAALSVFQGGFTHVAARSVGGVPLPVLSSLVDKSMLETDGVGRFDMHQLVAADTAGRAKADKVGLDAFRDRHAEYFAQYLEGSLGEHSADSRSIVPAVAAEETNCLLAWRRAIDRGRHDLVARMHPAWRAYFKASGKFRQSVGLFDQALGMNAPPQTAAELRATLAYFLYRNRQPERAVTLACEALAAAELLGDVALAQQCAATIGGCKLILSQWAEARDWVERSLALARQRDIRQEIATELGNLALITTFLGEFDRSIAFYEESIGIQTELDNSVSAARAMCNLGFVYVARGDWSRAQGELERALRYARDRNVNSVAIEAEFLLGSVLVELGQLESAQRHLERARDGFRATGNAGFELKTGYYLARIIARRGAFDEAGRDLIAAVRTAREKGWTYDVFYASIFLAEVLARRGLPLEAARILNGIRAAPRAHAFVGTLVDVGLRALPAGLDGVRSPGRVAESFDAIADQIVASSGIDDLVERLRCESRSFLTAAGEGSNARQTRPD